MRALVGLMLCVQIYLGESETDIPHGECDDWSRRGKEKEGRVKSVIINDEYVY